MGCWVDSNAGALHFRGCDSITCGSAQHKDEDRKKDGFHFGRQMVYVRALC